MPDEPDLVVFSYEAGVTKPEPEIYRWVLNGLALESGKVLFVGDTVKADIDGPREAGMKAVHVDKLAAEPRTTAQELM